MADDNPERRCRFEAHDRTVFGYTRWPLDRVHVAHPTRAALQQRYAEVIAAKFLAVPTLAEETGQAPSLRNIVSGAKRRRAWWRSPSLVRWLDRSRQWPGTLVRWRTWTSKVLR